MLYNILTNPVFEDKIVTFYDQSCMNKDDTVKAIITGGTGLVGSELAKKMASEGHEVVILSRNPDKHAQYFSNEIQVVRWDGVTTQGWGHLVDGANVIVNLAGESIAGNSFLEVFLKRWNPDRKREILNSRISASKALVEAIKIANQKPAVFIQASAVGYYGSRGDEELTEDSPRGDDFLAKVCVDWEQSSYPVEEAGVRRVIIRTAGVVLSTQGGAFPLQLLPFKLFAGGPIGNGRQFYSCIHISDEIDAIRFLIDKQDAHGAFNVTMPDTLTNSEFGKLLGRIIRRPYWLPLPSFAFKLLLGEKAFVLLASTRQIPKRLLEIGFKFTYPTAELALREILQR